MNIQTRALLAILLAVLTACSSSAGASAPPAPSSTQASSSVSAQPSAAASPSSAGGGGSVANADEAAQRVIALDPRFTGLKPRNPDLIGGCCFYEATTTADGFQVNVELGWGDCPAGCINRHKWSYAVARDGTTTLLSETGEPVPSGFPAGGGSTY